MPGMLRMLVSRAMPGMPGMLRILVSRGMVEEDRARAESRTMDDGRFIELSRFALEGRPIAESRAIDDGRGIVVERADAESRIMAEAIGIPVDAICAE